MADPKEIVSCKTVGDVVGWLKRLDAGEKLEKKQLVNLGETIKTLCNRLGLPGVINIEDPHSRSLVLSLLKDTDFNTSIDDVEEKVLEAEEDLVERSELGSKQISGPELRKLVEEYEDAIAKKETGRATTIADTIRGYGFEVKSLSSQDPHNLEGFIKEEKRKREESLRQAEKTRLEVENETGEDRERREAVTGREEVDISKVIGRTAEILKRARPPKGSGKELTTPAEERKKRGPVMVEALIEKERQKKKTKGEERTRANEEEVETVTMEVKALAVKLKDKGIDPALIKEITKISLVEMTSPTVSMEKVKEKMRVVLKRVKGSEEREKIETVIKETTAKIIVEKEEERVLEIMIRQFEEQGVVVPKEKEEEVRMFIKERIIEPWKEDGSWPKVKRGGFELVSGISEITGSKSEKEQGGVVIAMEKNRIIRKKSRERHGEAFRIEEGRVLTEKIVKALRRDKKNEEMGGKVFEEYAGLVVSLSQNGLVAGLRAEMEKKANKMEISPGKLEIISSQSKVLSSLLRGENRIVNMVRTFEKFKTLNLNVADKIEASRAVNSVMKVLVKNPKMVKVLEMARKVIRIEDTMGSWPGKTLMWVGKRIGSEGIQKIGSGMINGVVMREVVKNSMVIIGKKGLATGINMVGSSLIKGGTAKLAEVAAGMMVKGAAKGLAAKGATMVAGALGGVSGPVGWAITAGVWVTGKVVGAVKKGIMKVRERLEASGIKILGATQVRQLFSRVGIQLKKIPLVGAGLGRAVDLTGEFLYLLGLMMAMAMATTLAMVVVIIVGLFLFLIVIFPALQSPMISSLVRPVGMGSGVGTGVGGSLPSLVKEKVFCKDGGGKSVKDKVVVGIKQNKEPWGYEPLPKGCVFADSGCGPTAVASFLMEEDPNLTPYELVYEDGSPYKMSIGCSGSTMEQAKKSLEKHYGGEVVFDESTRNCNKQDIANWICDDKVVMVLANFYKNKKREIGGHFFLAVEVENGEIYSVDPFYDDGAVMDGTKEYGYVQSIRDCMVIDVGDTEVD